METLGSLVDKLSIVNLKIWHQEDIKRDATEDRKVAEATRKTNILNQERTDLIQEIDTLIKDAIEGRITLKNYKQGDTKSYGRL